MEKYKLSWVQSQSDFANEQQVKAKLSPDGPEQILAQGLLMNINSIEHEFETDAQIEWWVTTIDSSGTKIVDSTHDIFTAANLAELEPASALSHTWIEHIP